MLVTWLKTGALAGAITLAAGTAFAQTTGQPGTMGQPPTTGQSPTGQPPTGTGNPGAPGTMAGQDRDTRSEDQAAQSKKFVQHMLLVNMAEIQLGQMAAQQATSDDVKAFAQQMVTDHTKANEELKPIAQQLGIQEPTQLDSKHQKLADKLAKAQGADFDRQYMEAMVDGHKNVVKDTKRMAGGNGTAGTSGHSGEAPGSTPGTTGTSGATANGSRTTGAEEQAVTQFASKILPIVQQHLEHAQTIEQSLGKKTK
jgi:putative membrane protein